MTLTFLDVENVLKTLPIGYYIGRNVDVSLNKTADTSYYVPMYDKIEISFKQISNALSKISKDEEIEEIIRSLLYHEVSHAFLTPSDLRPTDIINVFEDERIETILKNYYMNTDFKKLVKLINDDIESISTPFELFYNVVRFRKGPDKFVSQVQNIIDNYSKINRLSGAYSIEVTNYKNAITNLYREIETYFYVTPKDKRYEDFNESEDKDIEKNYVEHVSDNKDEDETKIENVLSDEDIKKVFKNELYSPDLDVSIKSILQKIRTFENRNGSAIHSYSGVFNPRSAGRQDCRYFVSENRLGSAKAFSKFHLNLFIDNSGSFWESEETINKLIKSLLNFEKSNPNFTFDLVTINMDVVHQNKLKLNFTAFGGNRLSKDIYKVYNELQKSDCKNFNIVLFDGDAVSESYNKSSDASNFKAFDHSNTCIITDSANAWILKKYVQHAKKKVIAEKYAEELQSELLKTLASIV